MKGYSEEAREKGVGLRERKEAGRRGRAQCTEEKNDSVHNRMGTETLRRIIRANEQLKKKKLRHGCWNVVQESRAENSECWRECSKKTRQEPCDLSFF